jgi:hypothetical protein
MKLMERPGRRGSLASLSGAITAMSLFRSMRQVHRNELAWPSTWIDRLGRDRTPSIPTGWRWCCLGYGTTGLSVGQRVFRLTDWTRRHSGGYVAVEAQPRAPPGTLTSRWARPS